MAVSKATKTPTQRSLEARTIQEFIEHGRTLTVEKAFGFPSSIGGGYAFYSSQWLSKMADKAITIYVEAGIPIRNSPACPSKVGLRTATTIEGVIAFLALLRMGQTVVVISVHLSPEVLQSVVTASECHFLVGGTECLSCETVPVATLDQISLAKDEEMQHGEALRRVVTLAQEDETALVMHSSSSIPPKLMEKSHKELLTHLRSIPEVMHDKSCLMGSWFHWTSSIMAILLSFVRHGGPTCWPDQKRSNDPSSVAAALVQTKPRLCWLNAGFVRAASETDDSINALKQCIMVIVTGTVVPPRVASRLTGAGVRLATEWGMTELSVGLGSHALAGDPEYWDYMQPHPALAPHLSFRPFNEARKGVSSARDPLIYELIVLSSLPTLNKALANMPDGSFNTQDLFVKHPAKDCYKCIGRMMDLVELATSLEDNVWIMARTYEHVVESAHPELVEAAVVFGDDRPEPGMLIFAKSLSATSDTDLQEAVWLTVESQINTTAPEPAKIKKNMLVIVRDGVLPRTLKGDVIRPEVFRQYGYVIEAAYE